MSERTVDGSGGAAGPEGTEPLEETVEIRLLRYPLRLGARATQYYNDVFREFALIAADSDPTAVPVRLLALVDALGRRYAPQVEHEAERDEALARGETARDFVLRLPDSVGAASRELDAMLDESDRFCEEGVLLTLAAPGDVVAFRRWYLDEIARQCAGEPARAWPGALD